MRPFNLFFFFFPIQSLILQRLLLKDWNSYITSLFVPLSDGKQNKYIPFPTGLMKILAVLLLPFLNIAPYQSLTKVVFDFVTCHFAREAQPDHLGQIKSSCTQPSGINIPMKSSLSVTTDVRLGEMLFKSSTRSPVGSHLYNTNEWGFSPAETVGCFCDVHNRQRSQHSIPFVFLCITKFMWYLNLLCVSGSSCGVVTVLGFMRIIRKM